MHSLQRFDDEHDKRNTLLTYRHHFIPVGFTIPTQETHEPFEELYFDTANFEFLANSIWIIGRHLLCSDEWIWKIKIGTKLEQINYKDQSFSSKDDMINFKHSFF